MKKQKVLFVCVQNSARSQIAEAWLNHTCSDLFEAHSAGLEAGNLNPLAVEAMREVGIDISNNEAKQIIDLIKSGELFSYVITVCDETSAEKCPVFPGITKRLHWSFPDPAALSGTDEEKFLKIREIRDGIKAAVDEWCKAVRKERSQFRDV